MEIRTGLAAKHAEFGYSAELKEDVIHTACYMTGRPMIKASSYVKALGGF